MDDILEFKGEYAFLSNFYPSPFFWDDKEWPTVEHAYQSFKTMRWFSIDDEHDPALFEAIRTATTPGVAKRIGAKVPIRTEKWDERKNAAMLGFLRFKFLGNPWVDDNRHLALQKMLKATGECYLQEGNYWGDMYWGVDLKSDSGKNMLGQLLMQVRGEIPNGT